MSKILLVDDDLQSLESTRKILEMSEYQVVTASDGQEALDRIRSENFDLVVTDVRMPRLGGLEFLRALSLRGETTPVILMTAFGRVEDAVWAMKLGAVDFLTKPFKRQALLSSVEITLKRSRVRPKAPSDVPLIFGRSHSALQLQKMIEQVAPTVATILLTGESGSGKEKVARTIHELSARAKMPFIALNCGAVPDSLIESELFGFEKGAFTGASQAKAGLFEAANGGTLLLDEIGDMPLSAQGKLLRTLQENEVRRVGATVSKKIDVRVIAATHRNLKEMVASGKFREDLLYRLEVISIQLAPLRERLEDVPDLAYFFLKSSNARHGKNLIGISESAMEALLAHPWPGNIRELSNVIERGVVFAKSQTIELADLPEHLSTLSQRSSGAANASSIEVPLGTPLKDVEELLIRKTLEATDGDKNMTAKLLGINSRTIYRKLDKRD